MSGLSAIQREILLYVYKVEPQQVHQWRGVSWRPRVACGLAAGAWSRADAAAFSRSVRRLEQRGLLFRDNEARGVPALGGMRRTTLAEPPPLRTTHLKLTDAGRALAQRLTNGSV